MKAVAQTFNSSPTDQIMVEERDRRPFEGGHGVQQAVGDHRCGWVLKRDQHFVLFVHFTRRRSVGETAEGAR